MLALHMTDTEDRAKDRTLSLHMQTTVDMVLALQMGDLNFILPAPYILL